MGDFDIRFTSLPLNNLNGANSVNSGSVENNTNVFNTNVSNPIVSKPIDKQPVYTDDVSKEMFLLAGVEPTEAPEAVSTIKTVAVMETAGFDIEALDEAVDAVVFAHISDAYQFGTASRIERQNQTVATLIENLPEGTTEEEFEAFMYAIYS